MTTEQSPKPVPSRVKKTNAAAYIVWLIPVLAFLVGSWLFIQNIRNTGPEITLYMESADGIEVNNTVIRVLNVNVGRVTKIRLRPDLKGVELTARLSADARDMMRKDTQFWVVKPRIDGSGISGLNTLVSGSYIAFTPGKDEEEQSVFEVADIPPISALGQNGVRVYLSGANDKMLETGSPVMYESFPVGMVESAKFDPQTRQVNYTIFINQPNDKLINQSSRFWLDSGIRIHSDGGGIQLDSAPLSSLISGAISFETPDSHAPNSPNNQFELHNNRAAVDVLPSERALYYTAIFNQSVRGLHAGAPVEYKGIKIGSVAQVPYFAENDSLNLLATGQIPVRIRIEPSLLEQNSEKQSIAFWRETFQTALDKGLNATIASNNLVLGSKMIELTDMPSASKRLKPANEYNGDIVIATRGGGLDDMQAQVAQLLDKFNQLPLDKTLGELNGSLAELKATLKSANKLIAKPQTQAIPAEINKTMNELRQALQGISPDSPVYQDIQQTLNSLNKTLRDAQPVLNTLKEKPNALIFDSKTPDPIPKGQ